MHLTGITQKTKKKKKRNPAHISVGCMRILTAGIQDIERHDGRRTGIAIFGAIFYYFPNVICS